jgi:hypothetical protein
MSGYPDKTMSRPTTGSRTLDAVADAVGYVIGVAAAFAVAIAAVLLFLYFFAAGLSVLAS